MARAYVDLHCHTRASFDSLSRPADVVKAAARRGLTHVAITDHDRIDGALEAKGLDVPGIEVIVGQEIRTTGGDLIGLFLDAVVPRDLTPAEAIAAVRAQGGLVGVPHPFDRFRGSLGERRSADLGELAPLVDWIETHNARLVGSGNERAALFARDHGLPGVAVSDAHTIIEVGVAYTALDGDPRGPADLLAALPTGELVRGRGSYLVRLVTPVAKVVQRARGNGRAGTGSASR